VSDSCPAQPPPSTFGRTHTYRRRVREGRWGRGRERASDPLLSCWDMRPNYRLPSRCNTDARGTLPPEYMTRSTRINWHYGYDVVSLAIVTRLLPLSTTPRRFVPLLTVTCPFPIFNTTNMTMHNALAILPAAEREKKRRFIIKASIFE